MSLKVPIHVRPLSSSPYGDSVICVKCWSRQRHLTWLYVRHYRTAHVWFLFDDDCRRTNFSSYSSINLYLFIYERLWIQKILASCLRLYLPGSGTTNILYICFQYYHNYIIWLVLLLINYNVFADFFIHTNLLSHFRVLYAYFIIYKIINRQN